MHYDGEICQDDDGKIWLVRYGEKECLGNREGIVIKIPRGTYLLNSSLEFDFASDDS